MSATWFQGPAAAIIAASRQGFDNGVSILHFLGGHTSDVAGNRAIGQTKMTITQRAEVDGVQVDVVCTGRFYDFLGDSPLTAAPAGRSGPPPHATRIDQQGRPTRDAFHAGIVGTVDAACQAAEMAEISGAIVTGMQIADVSLTDARVRDVEVVRASFWRVRMRGAWIGEVVIDGQIAGLRINGVDVGPLIEAELDRRHPDRAKMRPADAAGFREAWDIVESLWAGTVDRARALPPELLHERVDGEWSFIQTLRHLVFATDIWVRRAILGDPTPWHPLSLPFDEMEPVPDVPWDRDARPGLEEVLALRADRMGTVRRVIEGLTEESLAARTTPVVGPGYPEPDSYPVAGCLGTVLSEEWEHRLYAERDLDVLQDRARTGPSRRDQRPVMRSRCSG